MRSALSRLAWWALPVLAGCATIRHGPTQDIPIASSPAGAKVSIDGVPVGTTPVVAKVARKQNHVVTIAHDTSRVDIALEKHLSPWVAGNWAIYIVPALVDFRNGSAYAFAGDTVWAHFPGGARQDVKAFQEARLAGARSVPQASRGVAMLASASLGFGVGHNMVGAHDAGVPFRISQLAGAGAASAGLMLGFSGTSEAAAIILFYGGAGLFVASRLMEVLDVTERTGRPRARLAFTPALIDRRVGVAIAHKR